MPIYEYRCESCRAELEKIQKISDPPLRECPECGKDTLVKMISASSFRLKGSGWYETDFKTGKKKNGAAEAGPESSDAGAAKPAAAESAPSAASAADSSNKESKDSKGSKESTERKSSKGSTESGAAAATTGKKAD